MLRHTDPKVTQDSYIVVKSNATTKAMRTVDASGLLKAWKKSNRRWTRKRNLWHPSTLFGLFREVLDEKWTKLPKPKSQIASVRATRPR